jgi:DNA replication protein DnaD
MKGWISLHRDIEHHWVWKEKPFSKGQAWVDILLMVNHEDKKIIFDNQLKIVKRGSRITSIRKLCDRWGWSNTKVRSFLELLQQDEMIHYKSDTRKTLLTVVKYNDYQGDEKRKTPKKHHSNTTETSLKHTNNNDNNYNNNIYILISDYTSHEELRQALKDFLHMRRKIKAPMTERALKMLLTELDKLAEKDELKIKIVEQSILNNWKSVYPLKKAYKKKKKKDEFSDFEQRTDAYTPEELDKIARRKFNERNGG